MYRCGFRVYRVLFAAWRYCCRAGAVGKIGEAAMHIQLTPVPICRAAPEAT